MRIALLATGNELVNGDITNTNSAKIAHLLIEHDYVINTHLVVNDDDHAILNSLHYLSQAHQVIIITGGLGPTTDDRTRFAVADFVSQPLIFDDSSWAHITQRFTHFNLPLTENNRQQALFPEKAQIFPNINGTANGCRVNTKNMFIYLLPGPPMECLPMMLTHILPDIQAHFQPTPLFKKKWRLFGVSESEIATRLEAVLKEEPVTTGYRIDYPYLEFKITAQSEALNTPWLAALESEIHPYLLAAPHQSASELLKEALSGLPSPLLMIDEATGGELYQRLSDRKNYTQLVYTQKKGMPESGYFAVINIEGLAEYWAELDSVTETTLMLTFTQGEETMQKVLTIPYRPFRVLKYAAEIIANQLLIWLFKK